MIVNFFDFDSTLINSPLPEEGKKIWEEKTGTQFPAGGWWGMPESLDMSIFDILPNKSVYNFYLSHKSNSKNILITSRIEKLSKEVKNVLKKNNIHLDGFYFKDSTRDKGRILLDHITWEEGVSVVNVFDDRDKEIDSFLSVKNKIEAMGIKLNIFKVYSGNVKKINENLLKNEGAIPFYTAIKVNKEYYKILEDKLKSILIKNNIDFEDFKIPSDYHMTVRQGALPLGLKMRGDIGKEVDLIVNSIGISDDAIAFGVSGYMSKNKKQHITMLYKNNPVDSNDIKKWFKIKNEFIVKGNIEEYFDSIKEHISKVIKSKLLNESFSVFNYAGGIAAKKVTKIFDNLKWKLTTEQKHYLDDMTNNHPDCFSDDDIKRASKYLNIPDNNLKSVLNSFFKYPELNYEQWTRKSNKDYVPFSNDDVNSSRLTIGNKPFTGKEVVDDFKNFQLKKSNKTMLPDNSKKFDTKTKKEQEFERASIRKRANINKPSYITEDNKVKFWLLVHLYSNINSKKIFEENKQVSVDIIPEHEDYDFNISMLKSNKKDKHWIILENLLNEFNKVFGTYYYVHDRHDLVKSKTNSIRYIIKHEMVEVNKPIWDSDMQKFAYPGNQRYEDLRIKAKNQSMPKIQNSNSQDLLKKFMAGEWDWKTDNAAWL